MAIRFHDLRHAHATQLLWTDVHHEVVSERLAHTTIGITTLDAHSYGPPGRQVEAAKKIDAVVRAAMAGS